VQAPLRRALGHPPGRLCPLGPVPQQGFERA